MFKLPEINFTNSSFLSEETIKYHYGKHHKTYIDNLNSLTKEHEEASNLVALLKSENTALFNNAAQAFYHTFYWLCLTPSPSNLDEKSILISLINKQYGSEINLKNEFTKVAMSLFGSGWTWLSFNKSSDKLEITNKQNAMILNFDHHIPLLVCDIWEHAYYIEYKNERKTYLDNFWSGINWGFVNENLTNKTLDKINEMMVVKKKD